MTISDKPTDERFVFRKTLTVAEQAMFTGISGNLGPQYVDATQARKLGFPGMVSFELAVAALATTSLAKLGGPKRRITDLALSFPEVTLVGSSIQAEAEVTATEGSTLVCHIRCIHTESGRTVVEGTARLETFGDKE